MGKIYIAECLNCGYITDELHEGCGMDYTANYTGELVCNFQSKKIEVINGYNLERIKKENEFIGFYMHDEKLHKKHQEYTIDYGEDIGVKKFTDQTLYVCPICYEFKVLLHEAGLWD